MKEIIDRILDGQFEYEDGQLEFSRLKVEITIFPGESYEGSFRISGRKDQLLEGYLYVTDSRMECLTTHFSGNEEEIGFIFHGNGMEEGDVLKGAFLVVSNQGEYNLPFVVMISHAVLESSMGNIKNLFHFANLAKSSWSEAIRIFYDPLFPGVFSEHEQKYMDLYRGLSAVWMNECNVEEFLIAIHKKLPVTYIIDEDKVQLDATGVISQQEILLTRNGWGYTRLRVESEGDFLQFDREVLTDDDFLGNRCNFHFTIAREHLHAGKNYGKLRFCNAFTSVELAVEADCSTMLLKEFSNHMKRRQAMDQLMRIFLQFRTRQIGRDEWMEQTQAAISALQETDETDPLPSLFQAQLLMTQESDNEAEWTLEHAKAAILQCSDKRPELWDYYLYLTTLVRHDEKYIQQITDEIQENVKQYPDNWKLAWLLLFLSEELNRSASRRWLFLAEQFSYGCSSPFIYAEAWMLLKADPSLLMNLDEFESQVIWYAAKHQLLTKDVIRQLHYMITRSRVKPDRLYQILLAAYRFDPDTETLEAICSLLIHENRQDQAVFSWYEKGVEENLRITRLYEYYMYSMDLEEERDLPKVIFLYFSFHNTLDYEHAAYFYANLIKQKAEIPDIYEKAQFQIREFVISMIGKRRISRNLAVLYEQVLEECMLDEELCSALEELLFTHSITTQHQQFRKVILLQPHLACEQEFPVRDGRAQAVVCEENAVLLLEDEEGNRMTIRDGTAAEQVLLHEDKIRPLLSENAMHQIGMVLHNWKEDPDGGAITQQNLEDFELLSASEEVDPAFRNRIRIKLLSYYEEQQEDRASWEEKTDQLLSELEPEHFTRSELAALIRYLTLRGQIERALDWIIRFGYQSLKPLTAARLASMLSDREDCMQAHGDIILQLCHYAFELGQSDDHTMQLMLESFRGSTKQLRNLWRAGRKKGCELHSLSERILIQMLYTGYYVGERTDIFEDYLQGEADEQIVRAFLSQCSYDYFVKDRVTDAAVFEELGKVFAQGTELLLVCKLAFVRYLSEQSTIRSEETNRVLGQLLYELVEQGITLSCFSAFQNSFSFMKSFNDKTILEYKTVPGAVVNVRYMIEHKESTGEDYHSREMKEVYDGVYTTQFTLFFGEKLFYYIVEETADSQEVAESKSISRSDISSEDADRFSMLNDIMISETLHDYDTMHQLMHDYSKMDFLQKTLFRIV